ncbi:MAG: chemotaxis protein [Gammaproteobacteria bacterium]|nr:chemotaxis protein [Gammaproteobacteria bacterium]
MIEILTKYLVAISLIFAALLVWIFVQKLSRKVAVQHPEFGPAREEGGGCNSGGNCRCSNSNSCSKVS